MILEIISILFLIVVTEIFYFGFFRKEFKVYKNFGLFFGAKLVSLMCGLLSWIFLIILPLSIKEGEGLTYLQVFGWYYGVIFGIGIFFGINWYITQYLDNKKKK